MAESNDQNNPTQRPVISGAIDYSPSNSARVENQPRPPRNLQDLLRYSTEVAGSASEPPRNVQPMDDESKRFLSEALQSMTNNVIAEMKKAIDTLESQSYTEEECDDVFDNLLELVDKIDFANDFHKIGGFRIFIPCLTSDKIQLRWRCCELIAELCQNNPYCQERCVCEGYLPRLLGLVNDDPSDIVKIKALYAVSCLVRESEAALKEFVANDGFSVVLRALQTNCEKLKIKSSFLLSSLCSHSSDIKDEVVSMGFVEQIISLIIENKTAYNVVEHLLSALNALVTDNDNAEKVCRRPELQLKSILEYIIDGAQGRDDAREVVEYAKNVEKSVFYTENDNSVEEDR